MRSQNMPPRGWVTVCLGFSTGHRCPAVTNSSSARPSSEPLARVMRTVRLISLRRVLAFSASRQEARPAPSCPAQADEIRRQDGYLPALQVSDHLTTLRAVLRRQHLVRRRGLVLPASERWAPAGELSKHTRARAASYDVLRLFAPPPGPIPPCANAQTLPRVALPYGPVTNWIWMNVQSPPGAESFLADDRAQYAPVTPKAPSDSSDSLGNVSPINQHAHPLHMQLCPR
ncbi:hypothetical protein BU26DRAFT_498640 [Trematosphaeria pertusa]|uniref:Uncharacterized protein n=1 Tax=Trematosphaeria pertusa TaxID=390896 RepID=A0A6A6IZT1_9PLEO|nr:uncharacterized protein BU26DRAFT_498640 [Trematosphaeria pertusa]KAF2255876.1 hypothetical protein BU26DRAFT_498640 [Trematosphaeria pertusa]